MATPASFAKLSNRPQSHGVTPRFEIGTMLQVITVNMQNQSQVAPSIAAAFILVLADNRQAVAGPESPVPET